MNAFLKSKSSYRNLISFRKAECIYDITYYFINANLEFKDRTRDQMLQAARSGKQNIVEGREAATTSRETEIKLYNVARASLQELLQDYEDYLRTRTLAIWTNTHPRYAALLRTCRDNSDTTYYTAASSTTLSGRNSKYGSDSYTSDRRHAQQTNQICSG